MEPEKPWPRQQRGEGENNSNISVPPPSQLLCPLLTSLNGQCWDVESHVTDTIIINTTANEALRPWTYIIYESCNPKTNYYKF